MKTIRSLCAVVAACAITACSNDDGGKYVGEIIDIPAGEDVALSRSEEAVKASLNGFATNLFQTAARNYAELYPEGDGNMLISPFSASLALSMTANSTDDAQTAKILELLGAPDLETVNSTCAKLMRDLSDDKGLSSVSFANSVWYNTDYSVSGDYMSKINGNFYGEVCGADFNDGATKDIINSWCASKTRGMVPSIVKRTNANDLAFIINALYFNSEWASQFNGEATSDATFHGTAGDALVKMMHQKFYGTHLYCEVPGASVLQLPYKGRYSMYVVLPDNDRTADEFSKEFDLSQLFRANGNPCANVQLDMPRFKIDNQMELTDIFASMGLPKTFASLEKMGIMTPNAKFMESLQKSSVSVNENGTEMASVTVVEIGDTSPGMPDEPKEVTMTLDRPFMFVVADTRTQVVLLAGRINNLPDAE